MKASIHFICLLLLCNFICHSQEIISPDKNVKITITQKSDATKKITFSVFYKQDGKYTMVLPESQLGISRTDAEFINGLTLTGVSNPVSIHDNYEMTTGKRRYCENEGTERTFMFKNAGGQHLNIIFRAYNNGVAFRYEFPEETKASVNIIGESTTYTLPENTERYMQEFELSYEGFYPKSTDGKGKKQQWGYPALCKVNNAPLWFLISEADMTAQHCATRLDNSSNPNEYKVTYPEKREGFNQNGVITSLPWKSQWHTITVGSLAVIAESTLINDVSAPNQLTDTGWIQPGAVSWIYWANNHGSKDYKKVVEYIDLAKEMGWPYALIDWEWDVMANGGTLEDAVAYAKSKSVKILVWYNSGTSWLEPTPWDRLLTAEKREKEFTWLNKMGIYGIKADFFAGDQQDMMQYYIEILKDAARHHLVVNFHGATVPRGWARTYPNLLTTEAVYGAEWYNNLPVLTNEAAKHNTTLPFTRNVVGSMDYTPVTFYNSQHPHITSYGHELALSVVFESALQHFADSPEAYNSLPAPVKDFLKSVPTVWDDTKLLDGYPGDSVIIARKKGNKWYIGGLNGTDTVRDFSIPLGKITKQSAKITLIADGDNDKSFTIKTVVAKKGETLKVHCLPRGGFTAVLEL